jgi:hypothetical protein
MDEVAAFLPNTLSFRTRVVYASGKPVAFESYGAKTIEAGKSVSIVIAINLGGSLVDVDSA